MRYDYTGDGDIVDNGKIMYDVVGRLNEQNTTIKQLKKDVSLLLGFFKQSLFAVNSEDYQAYNRLWDFVNDEKTGEYE